jgi:hypothetical protein
MAYHKLALIYVLTASWSSSIEAFAPASTIISRANAGPMHMVATTPAALGMDVEEVPTKDNLGSMIDLEGIVFSVSVWIQLRFCFTNHIR